MLAHDFLIAILNFLSVNALEKWKEYSPSSMILLFSEPSLVSALHQLEQTLVSLLSILKECNLAAFSVSLE